MSLRKLSALLVLAALTACGGSGSTHLPSTPTTTNQSSHKPQDILGGVGGLLSIVLCDAPPHIGNLVPTEIDLAVDSVAVVSNGTVNTIAQYPQPYTVNVLDQPTSGGSQIGIGQYFSGFYQQVQFTFDVSKSHLVANGTNYPISFLVNNGAVSSAGAGPTTTSSTSNGTITVTVNGNFTIGDNPAASIQADFNALESLAMAPDGSIISRPTLFAVPYSEAGRVAGTVTNASGGGVSGATVVALDSNGNVANTTSTDENGAYELHTLSAGTYSIVVYNSYTTATGQTVTASGNTNAAASVNGPSVTVNAQDQTQLQAIND